MVAIEFCTNQLHKVTDGAADASANDYSKYNDLRQGQSDNNYRYDAIGNLTRDSSELITDVSWNVYGKIQSITKNGQVIRYIYDAAGNRIFKYTPNDTTAYVRDASGNVLSVYSRPAGQSPIVQSETHLYGSSRLGIATLHFAVDTSIVLSGGFGLGQKSIFTRGEKLFELSNHLGNVLASIADRRIPVDANSDGTNESYKADVISAHDYYPFGMQMPGRKYAASTYRYGFNGKEKDNEIKGEGNQQDYGMRIYDTRLGRFLSVDPLTHSYPWYTPYQFAGNQPIVAIDLDGMEPFWGPGNFVWELWMEWKYGDPTGAKTLVSGAVQKASVQTGQRNYHNEKVPATVRRRLDEVNTLEANAKIAQGTGQAVKFNIETSFDIASSIIPIGEGAALIFRGGKSGVVDIALGLRNGNQLPEFAKSVKALHVDEWAKKGFYSDDVENFADAFNQVVDKVLNSGGKVKFDITGLDLKKAASARGKSLYDKGVGYTDWEFAQVTSNSKLLKAAEFYKDGKLVETKEVLKQAEITKSN